MMRAAVCLALVTWATTLPAYSQAIVADPNPTSNIVANVPYGPSVEATVEVETDINIGRGSDHVDANPVIGIGVDRGGIVAEEPISDSESENVPGHGNVTGQPLENDVYHLPPQNQRGASHSERVPSGLAEAISGGGCFDGQVLPGTEVGVSQQGQWQVKLVPLCKPSAAAPSVASLTNWHQLRDLLKQNGVRRGQVADIRTLGSSMLLVFVYR
jgi:hypothetical protein